MHPQFLSTLAVNRFAAPFLRGGSFAFVQHLPASLTTHH